MTTPTVNATPTGLGLRPNLPPATAPRSAPNSGFIQVVDNEGPTMTVVGTVQVQREPLPPSGYDEPPPDMFAKPGELPVTPRTDVIAAPAYPAMPTYQAQALPTPAIAGRSVQVTFNIRIGDDDTAEMDADYLDVVRNGDVLVFVTPIGAKAYWPKARNPGDIAAQIGNTVYLLSILPITFDYGGNQFRLAVIEREQQL